jgi:hypothetical protein
MSVGPSGGRFFSQRHVAFVQPWMFGQRMRLLMMLMGFSNAIRGMGNIHQRLNEREGLGHLHGS